MSAWRDALQPASFRGVPFLVDGAGVPVGRRTQTHEYAKRDRALVEDMGRRTRRHSVTAFVAGDDVFAQRDALLKALDTPGAGELVLPWLGRLDVTAVDCEMSHDRREGGMVRFDLAFVEGGDVEFPVATANTRRQASVAVADQWASARDRYSAAMDAINLARVNVSAARSALSGAYAVVQRQFAPIATVLTDVGALVDSVVSAPDTLLGLLDTNLSALDFGLGGYGDSLSSIVSASDSASELGAASQAGGGDTAAAVQAVSDLVQDAALYQAGAEVAAMEVPGVIVEAAPAALHHQVLQPPERPDVAVADDVIAARDALRAALWSAALRASHGHHVALVEMSNHASRHLTTIAAAGVRLVRTTPHQSVPALVLAYRRFGDATRGAEIVTRNRIAHPGFLPPEPLQVAAE